MNSHKHIIRRQTIDIGMAKGNNAGAIQDEVKRLYYDKILPKLDVLFSGLVTDETVIRIDKLDLDIGKIEKDKLEQQLIEKTISGIEKQLKEKLQFDVSTSDDVNILSAHQSVTDEFIYFLTYGYFSWRSTDKEISLLETALMDEKINGSVLAGKLDKLIKEKPFVADRLAFQFSDRFLNFLLRQALPGFPAGNVLEIIQEAFARISPAKIKNDARNYYWKIIFTNRSLDTDALQLRALTDTFTFVSAKHDIPAERVFHLMDKSKLSTGMLDKLEEIYGEKNNDESLTSSQRSPKNAPGIKSDKNDKSDYERNARLAEEDKSATNDIPIRGKHVSKQSDQTKSADDDSKLNDDAAFNALPVKENKSTVPTAGSKKEELPATDKSNAGRVAADEPIYLELAGLVILHSFLIPLFNGLNLTKDNLFINEEALQTAVQLTAYLATGETCMDESFLVLPKLLCGMELTGLIQKNIAPEEAELKEGDALLRQVIEYWPALKNTSPDGLRNTFLKREGKLSRGGLGWQLDVEHKTWDVLLSKLPWGYSLIKLPWMKEFLFVNWG